MIYESPDGGKTIRAREPHIPQYINSFSVFEVFDMLDTSSKNETLCKALNHAIMIYRLVKDYE